MSGTPLRLVSPNGTVHRYSGEDLAGMPKTLCGRLADVRWGTTRQRPVRNVTCATCVRLALVVPKLHVLPGEPVEINWNGTVTAITVPGPANRTGAPYERRRTCRQCGQPLSKYNAGPDCWSHGRAM